MWVGSPDGTPGAGGGTALRACLLVRPGAWVVGYRVCGRGGGRCRLCLHYGLGVAGSRTQSLRAHRMPAGATCHFRLYRSAKPASEREGGVAA